MNSVILSWICSLFVFLKDALLKSRILRIFNKIYDKISSGVLTSFTAKSFSSNTGTDLSNSIFYKACRLPFAFIELISSVIRKLLSNFWEHGIIMNFLRIYFNSFIALNTRFFGSIAVGFGLGYFLLFAISGGFSLKALIVVIIGALFLINNINVSDFLSGSIAVKFFQNITDFKELDFNFYNKDLTKGKAPVILGLLTGLLMGVIVFKSILFAIAVPFGIFALLLVLFYPIAGIFAAVFLAPLIPTMLLAGLCIYTLLALFINKSLVPDYKWKLNGVGCALILLLVILLISSILSFDAKKSLMVFAMYLVFFSFYFVIINTVETKKQLFALLKIFILSGAIVALYGVLQYIFKWDTQNAWIDETMFEEATMRAYSTLENPNVLGEYLLLTLPVAAVFMLKIKGKEIAKWVYAAIFLISALCLIFTQSRGCWLGFLLSAAIFVSFYKGKLWALIPLGILILPFIMPQTIIDRIMSIGNMSDSSTSYRVYIWYGTMEMLKTYFVGGIGMGEGAFGKIYPFYGYNAIVAPHSHNLFLQLTVEAGIGALITFLSAIVVFMKDSVLTAKANEKNSYEYLTSLAFASGVAGFLLQSMFDYTFYNYRVMAIFMMYLAFGAVLKTVGKEQSDKC